MAFIKYQNLSPYFETEQTSWYLSSWEQRPIPAIDSDQLITLPAAFEKRPDLLSYDLYGTTRLWWVFAVRNPNIIKDPIYSFKEGIQIFVTEKNALFGLLNA